MLTLPELCDRLKKLDEVTLLEILGIYSDELVDRFEDVIEEKYDELCEKFGNDEFSSYTTLDDTQET